MRSFLYFIGDMIGVFCQSKVEGRSLIQEPLIHKNPSRCESHAGQLEVNINGEYDFILADAGQYESGSPSPFVSVHHAQRQEFLCQINTLKDPQKPGEDACIKLDGTGKEL